MAITGKIKEEVAKIDLSKPKLSLGWIVGAMVGVGLLAVVYKMALKGVSYGEGVFGGLMGKVTGKGAASPVVGFDVAAAEAQLGI